METEKIISTILRKTEIELREFLSEESKITCPIEYEKRVISLVKDYGMTILQDAKGEQRKSRNSKKRSTQV